MVVVGYGGRRHGVDPSPCGEAVPRRKRRGLAGEPDRLCLGRIGPSQPVECLVLSGLGISQLGLQLIKYNRIKLLYFLLILLPWRVSFLSV